MSRPVKRMERISSSLMRRGGSVGRGREDLDPGRARVEVAIEEVADELVAPGEFAGDVTAVVEGLLEGVAQGGDVGGLGGPAFHRGLGFAHRLAFVCVQEPKTALMVRKRPAGELKVSSTAVAS